MSELEALGLPIWAEEGGIYIMLGDAPTGVRLEVCEHFGGGTRALAAATIPRNRFARVAAAFGHPAARSAPPPIQTEALEKANLILRNHEELSDDGLLDAACIVSLALLAQAGEGSDG